MHGHNQKVQIEFTEDKGKLHFNIKQKSYGRGKALGKKVSEEVLDLLKVHCICSGCSILEF